MAITREGIIESLAPLRPDLAELIPDRKLTRIEPVPCRAFDHRYTILAITHLTPYKPILHYVGYAEGAPAFILTEDPEAFIAMSGADGVHIASAGAATEYATTFLTVTRPLTRLTYLVSSLADVRFRPNLSADEQRGREEFESGTGRTIAPPTARQVADGFEVTAFLIVEQDLRRVAMHVRPDGVIDAVSDIIAAGLPLVAGGR